MQLTNQASDAMSSSGVSRNAVAKVMTMCLTIPIEIWYARFLVHSLGVGLYGLLPLATNVIMFGAIINIIIISSIGRFIAIEVHKGNRENAYNYYSTGCIIVFLISIFLLVMAALVSWNAPIIFKVPAGYENSTRFLFAVILLSFIVAFGTSAITIGTFVYNRLYLNDLLNFGKIVFSRAIAFILIGFLGFKLSGITLGLFFAIILTFACGILIHNKLTPDFQIRYKFFRKELGKKMITLSGWLFLRQVSTRLLIFTDLFIVNYLYGFSQSGLYAVALFFPLKLRVLTGPFAGLLKPVIMHRYAENDLAGLVKIVCQGIRLIGVVFAFPVGVLCGLYRPIFTIWVGPQYQSLSFIAVIMTCHISLNVSCYPLFAIQDAFNKVKIPSLFSCLMAGLYFLLVFIFTSSVCNLGLAGVALAGAVALTINHPLFNSFYTSLLIKTSSWQFYRSFLPGIAGVIMIAGSLYYIQCGYVEFSIYKLVLLVIFTGIIYCPVAWYGLLSAPERKFLSKSLSDLIIRFNRGEPV